MRKNIGSALALYPMPVAVVGAMNGDEPTWTLVAHVGIIGHDRVTVSLASAHFINDCIKKAGRLSVNLASEPMLPQVAVAGAVSGARQSKAGLFAWEAAENGAPLVGEAPVSVACTVADVYETPGFETFVCTIDGTYVDEADLTEAGKIDYARVRPVLFEFPTYSYLRTGEVIGPCVDFTRAARA
ncbi:MAG TPA: flavin reductase [Olsenella sp.]|nr:flavin reductase [Olsenella sp.]